MSNHFQRKRKADGDMEHGGYSSGHPWYYVRGGKRLSLKEIKADAKAREYRGYLAGDIEKADKMSEPKRTHTLRAMRAKAFADLKCDVSRYREVARKLARHRAAGSDDMPKSVCDDVHTNISLKHNHIYNDFGHLIVLDDLLSKQGDLFEF